MAFTTVAQIEDTTDAALTAAQQVQATNLIPIVEETIKTAAGSNIEQTTVTVDLEGHNERELLVPLQPLTSVSAVSIDGDTVTDYTVVGQSLWRAAGWSGGVLWRPTKVTMTITYGHATVPAPVRTLTEHLVLAGIAQTVDTTLGNVPNIAAEQIGDWSVTYRDDAPAHVLELTEDTSRWLRKTYGPTSSSVRSR